MMFNDLNRENFNMNCVYLDVEKTFKITTKECHKKKTATWIRVFYLLNLLRINE